MTRSTLVGVLVYSLLVHAAVAAVPWQHPLYLAHGGYWPQRVSLTITNGSVFKADSPANEPRQFTAL